MSHARKLVAFCVAMLALAAMSHVLAQPKVGEAEPDKSDWTLSAPRVGEMPERTLLHTTFETTFDQMNKVGPIIEELIKAAGENHIDADGYIMFIYKGVQMDKTKPFNLTIGLVVPSDTKPAGKYEVTNLPPFKCASALYNGGLATIGEAYQKHYPALIAAGNMPTDESRELYLYWEGEQSNNNVVWLQAGIQ